MASACPSGLHSRHVSSTDPAEPPCGACRHTHTRPLPLLPVSCRSQMRAVPSLDALASRLLVGHLRRIAGGWAAGERSEGLTGGCLVQAGPRNRFRTLASQQLGWHIAAALQKRLQASTH